MAVKIRLRRMGRKKQSHFRIVVAEGSKPRDGRIVENLGYYRPLSDPARLVIDLERVDHWLSKGATASDTVNSLINKARKGGDDSVAVGEPDPGEERARKRAALAAKRKAEREAAAGEEPEEAADEPEAEEVEEVEEAEAEAAEEPEAEAEEDEDEDEEDEEEDEDEDEEDEEDEDEEDEEDEEDDEDDDEDDDDEDEEKSD